MDLSGICTSAGSPLTLTNGLMTVDLTSYSTTSAINSAIIVALSPYVLTTTLGSYSTSAQVTTAIANALASYVTSSALTTTLGSYTDTTSLTTLLGAKQGALTASSGISHLRNSPLRGKFLDFFEILGRKWAHGGPGGVLKGSWGP